MSSRSTDGLPRLIVQPGRPESFKALCSPDDGTKPGDTQEIVANTMSFRKNGLPRDIILWVKKVDGRYLLGIGKINRLPGEMLIQKPDAAIRLAARSATDIIRDETFRRDSQNLHQEEKVKRLVTQGKGQVIGERFPWPIALVENGPLTFCLPAAPHKFFRNTREVSKWGLDRQSRP
jgi:hypothetical protein